MAKILAVQLWPAGITVIFGGGILLTRRLALTVPAAPRRPASPAAIPAERAAHAPPARP
jgi:hypothetical protein